jgi:hypothetical protein
MAQTFYGFFESGIETGVAQSRNRNKHHCRALIQSNLPFKGGEHVCTKRVE